MKKVYIMPTIEHIEIRNNGCLLNLTSPLQILKDDDQTPVVPENAL